MDKELRIEFQLEDGITLRVWRESDIETVFDTVMRERDHLVTFMRWMTSDYSIEMAEKFIVDAIGARDARKSLALGIFRGGELLGTIGFVYFDWEARKTEIGYWISKREEGKGIITRSTRRLVEYTFKELKFNRVEIRCSVENSRSAAVPIRLGFRKEGLLRQAELIHDRLHDFEIYGLLAEDLRP